MGSLLNICCVFFAVINITKALNGSPNETICISQQIQNTVESLNKLKGCRVIEGHLIISHIESYEETDYDGIEFPELTEVTGYVVIYRVNRLKSVGKLFPNLRIIRGNHLISNYSLVIFGLMDLEEIGLKSLLKIDRGSVRIERNPALCFVETIDWSIIASGHKGNIIRNNKAPNNCPVCPNGRSGTNDSVISDAQNHLKNDPNMCLEVPEKKQFCWNSREGQLICPPKCGNLTCNANGDCCDELCIGCADNDTSQCLSCRYITIENGNELQCVQKCPANTYTLENNRCVTKEECRLKRRPSSLLLPFPEMPWPNRPYIAREDGECAYTCPGNYYPDGPSEGRRCIKCEESGCRRECLTGFIDKMSIAKSYRGCTHIKGSIIINIGNLNGNDILRELETSFGDIEVIEGVLEIERSVPLVSLGFFKKLRIIKGAPFRDSDEFSLKVYDNPNLQALFTQNVTVERGRIFFHNNPKLCMKIIEEFKQNVVDLRGVEKLSVHEVAPNSNGNEIACDIQPLNVKVTPFWSDMGILDVERLAYEDEHQLLGYTVYLKLAPFKNVSMFDSPVDSWMITHFLFYKVYGNYHSFDLGGLKPATQYAYFVRTYTVAGETRGGLSPIQYFKTNPRPIHEQSVNVPNDADGATLSETEVNESNEFEDALYFNVRTSYWDPNEDDES